MVKKRILYLFALGVSFISVQAQDLMFTNTHQSLAYLNPSFSGSNGYMRNQSTYRNQWPNSSNNYATFLNTFDAYLKSTKGGVSVTGINDNQLRGTLKQNIVSLAYAQYFSFLNNNLKIIPSLQCSFGQLTLDVSRINVGDLISSRYSIIWTNPSAIPKSSRSYFDLASGILVNYKNSFFGASFANLLQPNVSLMGVYNLPIRTTVHASTNFKSSLKSITNLFAAVMIQNNYTTIQARGLMTVDNKILFGLGYQFNKSLQSASYNYSSETNYYQNYVSIFVGVPVKVFSITYSYSLNPLTKYSNLTAHELSFSFNFRRKGEEKINFNLEN